MTVQEHAFRAYYASMTDAELLRTAANRKSFIEIAQRILAEELTRRKLLSPSGEAAPAGAAPGPLRRGLTSIRSVLRIGPPRPHPEKRAREL